MYFVTCSAVQRLTIAPLFDCKLALAAMGLVLTELAVSTLTLVSRVGILSRRL